MNHIPTWDTQYTEGGILTMASHMQQEIDTLRARVAELEPDAARYRFIRVGDPDNAMMTWVPGLNEWTRWSCPKDADAAIDEAMKENQC